MPLILILNILQEFDKKYFTLFQLMSANVKNILANANLTENEGKIILNNLGVAAELFPFFRDKLSASFSLGNDTEESNTEEAGEKLSSMSIT